MVRNEQRTSVTGMQLAVVAAELADNGTGGGGSTGPSTPQPTSNYLMYSPSIAMSTWVITHTFQRIPSVTIFDEWGREVDADVYSTAAVVTVTHGEPFFGSAVLVA